MDEKQNNPKALQLIGSISIAASMVLGLMWVIAEWV
jgi:hypothetical protein